MIWMSMVHDFTKYVIRRFYCSYGNGLRSCALILQLTEMEYISDSPADLGSGTNIPVCVAVAISI